MASSPTPIIKKKWWAALIYAVLVCSLSHAFYHQETNKHTYSTGEEMIVEVNSLTSIRTQIPFSYYSLPYCIPAQGIKKSDENIGQLLMGDQILNSPYRFKMNVNESRYLCTTRPLNEPESKILKQRTRDFYRVNMILDYLPAMRFANNHGIDFQVTGFPVGYTPPNGSEDDYIINHLKFRVLVHEYEGAIEAGKKVSSYEIVGFEVIPCSIRHDPEKMVALHMYENLPSMKCPSNLVNSQLIRQQDRISYTYEVEFVKSNIKWQSRWDAFLRTVRVHWFSILNSFMVIFFLSGTIFVNLSRTMRRGKGAQAEMKQELSGWKLVVGDVFKEPHHSKLLCVMVADGVQILGTAVVITILAALGVITSPASQGMLLTWVIYLYLFLGSLAGYVGVRLWRTIKGTSEGWKSVSMSIASFFPSIVFVIFTALDFILRRSKSTSAIPISLYFLLLSLWFCICVPLTILGGFLGTRAETIKFPMETSQIPREIPPACEYLSWLRVLIAGSIPFGTLFVELFYILNSLWFGRFYYAFGFLLIVLMMLLVVCAELSVVVTYKHLNVEDWRWWWKAFYASASVALYVFLYSINYLVINLRGLSGAVSVTIYLGKSMIIAIAIMLATGAIGFLASLCFVHHLYSSLKGKGDLHSSIIGEDLETLLVKD